MVRDRADLVSPERQTHSCEMWAEMNGYKIEWYEDIEGHRSGRDERGRPGWQALSHQLDRPDVAGVIADSFDRCYRNVYQFLQFLNRLERLEKKLVTVKEGLDTTSILGRAIVTILMVIYQLESDQTSARMTANVDFKRRELGRHWGPTPFGCDRDQDGHLIPTRKTYWLNPINGHCDLSPSDNWEERRFHDALTAVYKMYASGEHSFDSTAAAVNSSGWRYYAKGTLRPFTRDDIRRLISFWQLYRGELPLGNITNTRNAEVVSGGHDPILPVELCDQVGAAKKQRSGKPRPRTPDTQRVYLLGDILYCGVCGQPLNGQYQDDKRRYRHRHGKRGCHEKWLLADTIEKEIITGLISLSSQGDLLAEIAAEAEQAATEFFSKNDDTKNLLLEVDRLKAKLDRMEDLYLDGHMEKENYLAKRTKTTQEIGRLEQLLYTQNEMVDFSRILERITRSISPLNDATPETKKALINSVIQRLDIVGGQIINFVPQPWAAPFF